MSSFFPPIWRPSRKDTATVIAPRIIRFQGSQAGVAAALNTTVAIGRAANNAVGIAADEILLLQHLLHSASGSGAQLVTDMLARITDPNGTVGVYGTLLSSPDFGTAFPGGDPANVSLTWQGSLVLGPNDFIRFDAVFSAGAVTNTHGWTILGVAVPRGNWQV